MQVSSGNIPSSVSGGFLNDILYRCLLNLGVEDAGRPKPCNDLLDLASLERRYLTKDSDLGDSLLSKALFTLMVAMSIFDKTFLMAMAISPTKRLQLSPSNYLNNSLKDQTQCL